MNRLARETSPYLLQHAHNPVDWYPWGEEAFAKARAEDKPILLSVGYATCHWCHVMERESFEDEAIARQLADGFVAIKVDREELPDVDHVYMSALQALSGHGGWPMNMFLTPKLAPFFGGTYFPPQPRRGMASFSDVLAAVREAWLARRDEIEQQAGELLAHIRSGAAPAPRQAADDLHARTVAQLAQRFDDTHGGFGRAPKFPQAPLLQYLLALAAQGNAQARTMLLQTLAGMSAGGLYDHVGGGFARYSTDARWHVPHFEKMLYDNAQLARVHAGAFRLTGDPRLRFVAEDTLAYLLREMHPAAAPAAFSSAQDADAEGVEGRFHVWTLDEMRDVLGDSVAAAARLYGATPQGNWEHGSSVLERREPQAVREALGLGEEAFDAWERSVRERLYAARARRTWPITDDKVLADWNGLALRAFAEAGRLLERDDFVEAARRLAQFMLATMVRGGVVHHAWRDGTLRAEAYLADQAQFGLGLLELHAATGDPQWLVAARERCECMIERFHDAADGFFDAPSVHLPMRARDWHDGALPSGTAAACELLLRLAGPWARADWHELAIETLQRHGGSMDEAAMAVPALLQAHLLAGQGSDLAVPSGPGSEALWHAARTSFAPLVTMVHGAPGDVPLMESRLAGQAYLCRHGRCELPAQSVEDLRSRLSVVTPGLRDC
ncbi:thioredoxin domain-containing protein [Piscinibacter sp. XHJ-5]|uniref:thioredoxin domain-containing protein n=1 Tax=Piscinibacter sp. XHJ-5 TaxID=3037797 RepID=UPI002452E28B|nr:thioredoxin domain-containing protein [Piscinibacter sp. XHJ-5]